MSPQDLTPTDDERVTQSYLELPPGESSRLIFRLTLISFIVDAIVASPPWIVFGLEPFRNPHSVWIIAAALALYCVPASFSLVGSLFNTKQPLFLRTIEQLRVHLVHAVCQIYALLVGMFAAVYYQLAHVHPDAFAAPITNHMVAVYFTVSVFTTTGFGDIHATREASQALVTAQMVVALALIAVVVAALTSRLFETYRMRTLRPWAATDAEEPLGATSAGDDGRRLAE
jgi:hypothetical protein